MALSFKTVQDAYVILSQLRKIHLSELDIPSWPHDMSTWERRQLEEPPLNEVLGSDRKSDGGWESLVFFVKDPSKPFINAFRDFNTIKSNSAICRRYSVDSNVWVFGWF